MGKRKPQFDPADFTDAICEWIASGNTLTRFCATEGNPSIATVWNWRHSDPAFAERFARAREAGAECYVEMAQDVADDDSDDWDTNRNGELKLRSEHVQRSKLRVETLLKRAANFCPARFGSKVQLGGDPTGVPIATETKNVGPPIPSEPDLLASIAKLHELAQEHLADDGDEDA